MKQFKINKTNEFTIISTTLLTDKELTLKSKGLLCIMLSLPDKWDYSIKGLCDLCGETEYTITSILKELKQNGYLVVEKLQPNETTSGRFEYIYNIYEVSQKQDPEKQALEKQALENHPLVFEQHNDNNIYTNNNINNNIINNTNNILDINNNINTNNIYNTNINTNLKEIERKIYQKKEKESLDTKNTQKTLKTRKTTIPPTLEEVTTYCAERNNKVNPEAFIDFYESKNWFIGKNKMVDWKAAVRTWERNCKNRGYSNTTTSSKQQQVYDTYVKEVLEVKNQQQDVEEKVDLKELEDFFKGLNK